MEIEEKLIESGRTVNNYLWIVLAMILIVSGYLVQRTMQFSEEEGGFMGAQAQHQPQIQQEVGPIKLEFTYATMNIAWIWVLAVFLISASLLLKKRTLIYKKLSILEKTKSYESLLLPLDFFSEEYSFITGKVMLLFYLLTSIVCALQLFPVALHFIIEARFIEGFLIIAGTAFSAYAIYLLERERRLSHNKQSQTDA